MAAFMNPPWDAEISLAVEPTGPAAALFQWSPTNQPHNNEPSQVRFSKEWRPLTSFDAEKVEPASDTMRVH